MTKVILLAGGKGSRLNDPAPKPLVKIGNITLIEHVMNCYAKYGYNDFYLATGYRHEEFEKYFNNKKLPYNITLKNTGENTETGDRISQMQQFVKNEVFCLSYGDGVIDVNLKDIEDEFVENSFSQLQITATHPPERYGLISLSNENDTTSYVLNFNEKPKRADWINGGFMVCNPSVFSYIYDEEIFEQKSIPRMVEKGIVTAYKHEGNWASVDTQKDLNTLSDMWNNKTAFWL